MSKGREKREGGREWWRGVERDQKRWFGAVGSGAKVVIPASAFAFSSCCSEAESRRSASSDESESEGRVMTYIQVRPPSDFSCSHCFVVNAVHAIQAV